jgi:predicted phosphodiesterase
MKIVCLSDTHDCNAAIGVPDGDLLIHSGDATTRGTVDEVAAFIDWFGGLPHPSKIFVAGNHDWLFQKDNPCARSLAEMAGITYLEDSGMTVGGLRIYGSPWQPRFFDWAFNLDRGAGLAAKWAAIPEDTEILITHGPPHGILDEVPRQGWTENAGCEELRVRIAELSALKLHVFGHIHCGYGVHRANGVTFVNASNCDEEYRPTQPPVVIEI